MTIKIIRHFRNKLERFKEVNKLMLINYSVTNLILNNYNTAASRGDGKSRYIGQIID